MCTENMRERSRSFLDIKSHTGLGNFKTLLGGGGGAFGYEREGKREGERVSLNVREIKGRCRP